MTNENNDAATRTAFAAYLSGDSNNDVATRLVFRTELTDGPEEKRLLSTGTRYGSDLTPTQFAEQLAVTTRQQRPHLRDEFLITVWEEDASIDSYPLRTTPPPVGATTFIAPSLDTPVRLKSKRCSSGECTHAKQGLTCSW